MKETNQEHTGTIGYYNDIAMRYDSLMENDTNTFIRNFVQEYFTNVLKPCTVLDFGGGTGLDLPWLTRSGFRIIFCEKSKGMREIAIGRVAQMNLDKEIKIIPGDKTDFHNWQENNPPFDKTEAVLANFNVVNNISEVDLLFNKLASVMSNGGHFIGTVMDYGFWPLLKKSRTIALRSLIHSGSLQVKLASGCSSQEVYIYSRKRLSKAYSGSFKLIVDRQISNTGFRLLHLQKI